MSWSVVQTHPNASSEACAQLRRQGVPYYNPRFNERFVLRGRVCWRRVQLFSNYMFVQPGQCWRAVLSTRGVAQLLLSGDAPAKVRDEEIDRLRAMEDDAGLVVLGKRKFVVGDRVEFKTGPLAFVTGLYDGQAASDRAFVLLAALGRVVVDEGNLVAA